MFNSKERMLISPMEKKERKKESVWEFPSGHFSNGGKNAKLWRQNRNFFSLSLRIPENRSETSSPVVKLVSEVVGRHDV